MYYSILIKKDCKLIFTNVFNGFKRIGEFKSGQVIDNCRIDKIGIKHYLVLDNGDGAEIDVDFFEKKS